ncbi:benzil reductase ((S)-benzoin forming) [Bacillus pakistanensis]|uniref:Benzil reductase ((S)-benzoin forming) n=1 Tax=Rossellomorea pakistanensis TaxID=992288 RepID=A0ABS2NJN4_9BACI|nr:(S)-benzoin forming benzil reductase [Bacillus pakistanensis]MBM7588077.1 benzil reductase ((S)-benzoin forming) [Bacillus pakistanensis]
MSKVKYAIITGASRGLGESICKQLVDNGIHLLTVSRSESDEVKQYAEVQGVTYQHFPCDLSKVEGIQDSFSLIMEIVNQPNVENIYLINNAGMVDPINTAGNMEAAQLQKSVNVNLLAPMIITNMFLERTNRKDVMIANITSGAGSRAVHGWSAYSSTKAGLNMFTETVALELANHKRRERIFAFSPGVMDTEMQGVIRSANKEAFADIDQFKQYKERGMLRSTETVASALVELLLNKEIESGKIYHVNDLLN